MIVHTSRDGDVAYWITGPGREQRIITYWRKGKAIRRPMRRGPPAQSTKVAEGVVLGAEPARARPRAIHPCGGRRGRGAPAAFVSGCEDDSGQDHAALGHHVLEEVPVLLLLLRIEREPVHQHVGLRAHERQIHALVAGTEDDRVGCGHHR